MNNVFKILIVISIVFIGVNVAPSLVSAVDCECGDNEYDVDSISECCERCGRGSGEFVDYNGSGQACSDPAGDSDDDDDDDDDTVNDNSNRGDGGGSGGSDFTDAVRITNPLGNIDTTQKLIGAIISGVMGIVGILAVAALVYGGILYLISGGNEEQAGKAKKVITYAVMGLIISLLSYVIVNTIIRTIGG